MLAYDTETTHDIINTIGKEKCIKEVRLFNKEGRVIYSNDPALIGTLVDKKAESCYVCHSQMIRPFRAETERYGHYSVAGEFVYDHPFQWGSKRTGPDLARVGGRYSDDWHRVHLNNPRDVVPESIMPSYPWLKETQVDSSDIVAKFKALKWLGVPYTDEDMAGAVEALKDKTELDAVIDYLQNLGLLVK